MNLADIFPLIVPSSYYRKGIWDLPHYQFPDEKYLLTWVFFNAGSAMSYITLENFAELNKNNKGWQQQAFENLRHSITGQENFFTHQNQTEGNDGIKFLAFLHSDGIGSSRILLDYELAKAFPDGYYVALPDRSCGLVIPKSISSKNLKEVKELIKTMFKDATTPMSAELYSSESFLLPKDWLIPIDKDFSKMLVGEINKINVK
jgi:hypothetical protein